MSAKTHVRILRLQQPRKFGVYAFESVETDRRGNTKQLDSEIIVGTEETVRRYAELYAAKYGLDFKWDENCYRTTRKDGSGVLFAYFETDGMVERVDAVVIPVERKAHKKK